MQPNRPDFLLELLKCTVLVSINFRNHLILHTIGRYHCFFKKLSLLISSQCSASVRAHPTAPVASVPFKAYCQSAAICFRCSQICVKHQQRQRRSAIVSLKENYYLANVVFNNHLVVTQLKSLRASLRLSAKAESNLMVIMMRS